MGNVKPGDRYQHDKWPAGTPDAVVGSVDAGCVQWAERGGSHTPNMLARHLITELGWRRALPDAESEA